MKKLQKELDEKMKERKDIVDKNYRLSNQYKWLSKDKIINEYVLFEINDEIEINGYILNDIDNDIDELNEKIERLGKQNG